MLRISEGEVTQYFASHVKALRDLKGYGHERPAAEHTEQVNATICGQVYRLPWSGLYEYIVEFRGPQDVRLVHKTGFDSVEKAEKSMKRAIKHIREVTERGGRE